MTKLTHLLRCLLCRRIEYASQGRQFVIPDYIPRWYYWRWWRRLYGAVAYRGLD